MKELLKDLTRISNKLQYVNSGNNDIDYECNKANSHVFDAIIILKQEISKEDVEVPDYNKKLMTLFIDGELTEGSLSNFVKVVADTHKNLSVVYNTEYNYHHVAYLGTSDKDFEWTDEIDELYNVLHKNFIKNNITFG